MLSRVFSALLPAASRSLWRHEDHQTGGRRAHLLSGPAERNIQQAAFTMTAQDQQLRLYGGRHLHKDLPGIARASEGGERHALSSQRCSVGVHFLDHEGIRPLQQLILLAAGTLSWEMPHVAGGIVIDTKHLEMVGGALGQCRGYLAGGQGMGTGALLLLERGG